MKTKFQTLLGRSSRKAMLQSVPVVIVTMLFVGVSTETFAQDYPKDQFGFSTVGFLPEEALLPLISDFPAPKEGPAGMLDTYRFLEGLRIREVNPERYEQAKTDAVWSYPLFIGNYLEAIGKPLEEDRYEAMLTLIAKAEYDVDRLVGVLKSKFDRQRPYVYYSLIFDPNDDVPDRERLRHSGAYPSGHAALAHITSLILKEIFPGKAARIRQYENEYARSRTLLLFHWESDLRAGAAIADLVWARLQADEGFQEAMATLKAEIGEPAPLYQEEIYPRRRAYE